MPFKLNNRTGRLTVLATLAAAFVFALAACDGTVAETATPSGTQAADSTPDAVQAPTPSAERSPTPGQVPSPTTGRPTRGTPDPRATSTPMADTDAEATAKLATALSERAETGTAFARDRDESRPPVQERVPATVQPVRPLPVRLQPRIAPTPPKIRITPTPILRLVGTVSPRFIIPPVIPKIRLTPTPVKRRPTVIGRITTPTPGKGIRPTATPVFGRLPTATPTAPVKPTAVVKPTRALSTPTPIPGAPTLTVPTATATPAVAPTATQVTGGGGVGGGGGFSGSTIPGPAPMSMVVGAELFSFDDVFLGDLVPASRSIDSVCDTAGQYGSDSSSTSIRNPFGAYGDRDGAESAFSLYAVNPPVVMLLGERLGVLTVSPFFLDAINPFELLKELECS